MGKHIDELYKEMVLYIMREGEKKGDRTGTGTISVFNYNMVVDLQDGFPLLTTKFVPFRLIAEETIMFLKGITDLKYLLERKVDIWTRDAYKKYLRENDLFENETGEAYLSLDDFREIAERTGYDLGPIYGAQWRDFNGEGVDQLKDVIHNIKQDPNSRRLKVYSANPAKAHKQTLPPCHDSFQFYVRGKEYLDLKFSMRSSDVFHGFAFNIASYALITHIVAHLTGLRPGKVYYDGGDVHIYLTHLEALEKQLLRTPCDLPELIMTNREIKDIDDIDITDFDLMFYEAHGRIKAPQSF